MQYCLLMNVYLAESQKNTVKLGLDGTLVMFRLCINSSVEPVKRNSLVEVLLTMSGGLEGLSIPFLLRMRKR